MSKFSKPKQSFASASSSDFPRPVLSDSETLEDGAQTNTPNTSLDDYLSFVLWHRLDLDSLLLPSRLRLTFPGQSIRTGSQQSAMFLTVPRGSALQPFRVKLLQLYYFLYGKPFPSQRELELDGGKPLASPSSLDLRQALPTPSSSPSSLTVSRFSLELEPDSLKTLSKLRHLSFYQNILQTSSDTTTITKPNCPTPLLSLENVPDLTHITFQDNIIRKVVAGATPAQNFKPDANSICILPAISTLFNLVFLDLQHNHLNGSLFRPILDALPSLLSLHTLVLSHNSFTEIHPAVFQTVSLTRLEMSYNDIERIPLEIGNRPTLETFEVAHNRIYSIPQKLCLLPLLKRLDLSYNRIEALPMHLGNMPQIQCVMLQHNKINKIPASLIHWISSINITVCLEGNNISTEITELNEFRNSIKITKAALVSPPGQISPKTNATSNGTVDSANDNSPTTTAKRDLNSSPSSKGNRRLIPGKLSGMLPVILQDHEMKEERKPVPVAANETDKTPTSSKPEWRESWPKLLNVPSDISHLICVMGMPKQKRALLKFFSGLAVPGTTNPPAMEKRKLEGNKMILLTYPSNGASVNCGLLDITEITGDESMKYIPIRFNQVFTRACAFVFLYTSMDKADLRRVMKLRSCVVQARKEPLGFPCLFPDAPSFIVSVSAVPTEIDTFGEDLAKKFQATFCILLHSVKQNMLSVSPSALPADSPSLTSFRLVIVNSGGTESKIIPFENSTKKTLLDLLTRAFREDTSLSHISLYTSYIQDILGQPVSLSSTEIPGTVVLFDLRDLPKSESPATSRHESIKPGILSHPSSGTTAPVRHLKGCQGLFARLQELIGQPFTDPSQGLELNTGNSSLGASTGSGTNASSEDVAATVPSDTRMTKFEKMRSELSWTKHNGPNVRPVKPMTGFYANSIYARTNKTKDKAVSISGARSSRASSNSVPRTVRLGWTCFSNERDDTPEHERPKKHYRTPTDESNGLLKKKDSALSLPIKAMTGRKKSLTVSQSLILDIPIAETTPPSEPDFSSSLESFYSEYIPTPRDHAKGPDGLFEKDDYFHSLSNIYSGKHVTSRAVASDDGAKTPKRKDTKKIRPRADGVDEDAKPQKLSKIMTSGRLQYRRKEGKDKKSGTKDYLMLWNPDGIEIDENETGSLALSAASTEVLLGLLLDYKYHDLDFEIDFLLTHTLLLTNLELMKAIVANFFKSPDDSDQTQHAQQPDEDDLSGNAGGSQTNNPEQLKRRASRIERSESFLVGNSGPRVGLGLLARKRTICEADDVPPLSPHGRAHDAIEYGARSFVHDASVTLANVDEETGAIKCGSIATARRSTGYEAPILKDLPASPRYRQDRRSVEVRSSYITSPTSPSTSPVAPKTSWTTRTMAPPSTAPDTISSMNSTGNISPYPSSWPPRRKSMDTSAIHSISRDSKGSASSPSLPIHSALSHTPSPPSSVGSTSPSTSPGAVPSWRAQRQQSLRDLSQNQEPQPPQAQPLPRQTLDRDLPLNLPQLPSLPPLPKPPSRQPIRTTTPRQPPIETQQTNPDEPSTPPSPGGRKTKQEMHIPIKHIQTSQQQDAQQLQEQSPHSSPTPTSRSPRSPRTSGSQKLASTAAYSPSKAFSFTGKSPRSKERDRRDYIDSPRTLTRKANSRIGMNPLSCNLASCEVFISWLRLDHTVLDDDGFKEEASEWLESLGDNSYNLQGSYQATFNHFKSILKDVVTGTFKQDLEAQEKELQEEACLNAPSPFIPTITGSYDLLMLNPIEIGRQMTIVDSNLFRKIRLSEFLQISWTMTHTPNVKNFTERFNRISQWVTATILKTPTSAQRATIIEFFITVAKTLFELNNFHGLMSVMTGLQSSGIERLIQSWMLVKNKSLTFLMVIKESLDMHGNFAALQKLWEVVEPPIIPYIGIFLTHLTMLGEIPTTTEKGLWNFEKLQTISKILRKIGFFQIERYRIIPVEFIQQWIDAQESEDEDTLYDISLKQEPREDNKEILKRVRTTHTTPSGTKVHRYIREHIL